MRFVIVHENTELCKLMLDCGADVNATQNSKGLTLLHQVANNRDASNDCIEICKMLLDYGADVNAKDNDSNTPLRTAKLRENLDLYNLLKQYGGKD